MINLRNTLLFIFLFAFILQLFSQNNEADSLKKLLSSVSHDTSVVNNSIALARLYVYQNPDSAIFFANNAITIAQENELLNDVVVLYSIIGLSNIVKNEYFEGLSSLTKALELSKQILEIEPDNSSYKADQSVVYIRLGHIHYYQGNYDLAINDFFNAVKILEEIGDKPGVGTCLTNISVVYESLNNFSKAVEYNQKALLIANTNNDKKLLAHISNNLCVDYIRLGDYDSAYHYISKCIQINKEVGNRSDLQVNYVNLARVFAKRPVFDSALYYLELSLGISTKLKSTVGMIDANYLMGKVYLDMKSYDKAEDHFKKSIGLAEKAGILISAKNTNEMLSDLYKETGDYKQAYEYFVAASLIEDSVFSADSEERIAEMEAKYQSEKKEEEIKLLQETAKLNEVTSKTNRIIFSSIIIILVLFIVLVIISYRSYKHKQLAERRRIQQNAERKILDAVIETEYKERKRFAEDLHDGLGVLLSTIRLYINEIEDSSKDEQKALIKQSNSMLDDAIANARNISNNIMPAALKNNGLEMAIRSFSDKINASGKIKIDVQSVNFKIHYKNTVEITLYRILTEMINNTLKHAEASRVSILLSEKYNNLYLTYKDNGKGFDYQSMLGSTEKGMGLDNTISRINSIGGKCEIHSKNGEGFLAKIEVSVK